MNQPAEPHDATIAARRSVYWSDTIIAAVAAAFYTCFIGLMMLQPSGSIRYLPDLAWYAQLPFAFLAAWLVAFILLWTFHQMDDAHRGDLAVICSGGALGGFMLKFAVLFLDENNRPAIPLDHVVCALLGLVCAGVTVYLVTETEGAKKPKLFFLSVTAGLAFPSVLVTLLNPEAENVDQVEQKLERVTQLNELPAQPSSDEEIARIDGEVASTVAEIKNAPSLPLQEKVRRIEKIEPIVQSAFAKDADSQSVAAITQAKEEFASQVQVIEQRIAPSPRPSEPATRVTPP